ncbi:OmpA family protein [Altererythrobacter sp. SALINAS58]|uniref:OmpA family protein n=1 Tax=Alteripontixanthobacter muriae TaxID=2705546 RepID=UPI001576592D|nr:OmpA family protein [Alteripontixanthobacter muriae]NTZ43436.1 OmpA family protein [Alteripontixanthobacter muriae]
MMRWGTALIASMALTACDNDTVAPEPEETAIAEQQGAAPTTSIIRPDVEVVREEPAMQDLKAVIPFSEGGAELSQAAEARLAEVLESPQIAFGGPIVLRGHSDAVGRDEANLRASRERAEAVREYLVQNGIEENRIRVIALGEMRPIAPNATEEGEPYEEGRAANRRVELFVDLPEGPPAEPDIVPLISSGNEATLESEEPIS